MALQSYNIAVGNLTDDSQGNNYSVNAPVYITDENSVSVQIYKDLAGTIPIPQNGVDNTTDENGTFTFYVEAGQYLANVGGTNYIINVVGSDYFDSRIDETITEINQQNKLVLDEYGKNFNLITVFDFATGGTIETSNQLVSDSSGSSWQYQKEIPTGGFVVAPGTVPSSPTWEQRIFNDHSILANRNETNAHDEIYTRRFSSVANLRAQTSADGTVVDMSKMGGSEIEWSNYYDDSLGGGSRGVIKTGNSTSIIDDGGTKFVIVNDTVNGVWVESINSNSTINVKQFGAKGDGLSNDTDAFKRAFEAIKDFKGLYIPEGLYLIREQITTNESNINISGDGKYISRIGIHPDGWLSGTSLIHIGDGVNTARVVVEDIQVSAANGSLGNDLDGMSVNPFFNLDVFNCRFQSGNYVTRETGGLRIMNGKHTRLDSNQFHNGFCHGLVVDNHSIGLNLTNNAFDETSVGIRSLGDIFELNITSSNEFGAAIRNSTFPAPVDKIVIDLTVGAHGTVNLTSCIFTGGSDTEYHLKYGSVDRLVVDGNQLKSAKRYSIAGIGPAKDVTISDNAFAGNGTGGTTTNPANGTREVDTTPFCSDVFLRSAFNNPINFVGNTSDIDDKVVLWAEGTGASFSTSGLSMSANKSAFSDIAYIHQQTITENDVIQNANYMMRGLSSKQFTISARTINRGSPQFGTFLFDGAEIGDSVNISADVSNSNEYNINYSARVTESGQITWSATNTSDTGVTIPDTNAYISVSKP